MKLIFIWLFFALISGSVLADFKTVGCGIGYGPDENNTAIIIDDEDEDRVLRVGYTIVGNFFEFKVVGCRNLTRDNQNLLCDGKSIGSVGKTKLALGDPGYNGPRADVRLDLSKTEVTGSCSNPKNPLTLTVR